MNRDRVQVNYPSPIITDHNWMARPADSWLDEPVTVRRVIGLAAFWFLCLGLPATLALVVLR